MTPVKFQTIITGEDDVHIARKRRAVYLRPFILFYFNSLLAEIFFFTVAVLVMSGTKDLIYKIIWTLVVCPLGMGAAMGSLINVFVVDHHYGSKAVHFTAILTFLVLSACNYLCYSLDYHFGYFGAEKHPMWFHLRYPILYFVGYTNGKFLFTDEGQEKLSRWGL